MVDGLRLCHAEPRDSLSLTPRISAVNCSARADDAEAPGTLPGEGILWWEFHSRLTLRFTCEGSCCPDTNRFEIYNAAVRGDSIVVGIADRGPIRCLRRCRYLVTLDYPELPRDSYLLCITFLELFGPLEGQYDVNGHRTLLSLSKPQIAPLRVQCGQGYPGRERPN
jgi:hypothetical protein